MARQLGGAIGAGDELLDVVGLYFLGLPWQHRRGSALLGFVQEDAAYLADRITSRAPRAARRRTSAAAADPSTPVP